MTWDGRVQAVARVLVIWRDGELPAWWDAHHTCRHKWCVEVSHLEGMPRREHTRLHQQFDKDKEKEDRGTDVMEQPALFGPAPEPGPAVPAAAITIEERRAKAREYAAQGWSVRRIADAMGVSRETARRDVSD